MENNKNNKLYNECSACHQQKKEDTFTRCYNCNIKLKNLLK